MAGPDPTPRPVSPLASPDTPTKKETKALPCLAEEGETNSVTSVSPPDGGWGWVVVLASFVIHVIADGITYSFGIFLPELISEFSVSRGTVSLIPSILVGVTLGSGPIASTLVNRYGLRAVTIAGAVLASAGLALSMFANSIALLYFTVGVCTGLGFGLIYLPAIVSVSIYFEKKRAFATGIAVCGSGLGTFIMGPVTEWLIETLKWRYSFLVLSGLVILCIVFGALFRPLEPAGGSAQDKNKATPEEKAALTHATSNGDSKAKAKHVDNISNGNAPSLPTSPPPPFKLHQEIQLNGSTAPAIRPFAQQMGMGQVLEEAKYNDMARMAMSHPAFLDQAERPQVHFGSHSQFQDLKKQQQQTHLSPATSQVMARKDIFYSGSLYNIPEYKQDPHSFRRSMRHIEDDCLSTAETQKCCNSQTANQMIDFSLFRDPIFLMYAVSNFLTSIGFNVPYVFTVDRALLWGIDKKHAAFLLSVVGIANTISRVVLGLLSDCRWVNRLYLYNSCLIMCGLSMGLSVFCTTYYSQAFYCAIFGITSGAYVGLTSVVLVDLLGLDKLTNAFGLLLLFQGIASVMGPPVIGALYDFTGNYDAGFYLAGTMIFLSGAMLFGIPFLQRTPKSVVRGERKPSFNITSGRGQDDLLLEVDQ